MIRILGSGYQGNRVSGKTMDRKRRPETPSIEVTVASKSEEQLPVKAKSSKRKKPQAKA